MKKLKDCPFCGSDNIFIDSYDPYDGYQGNLTIFRIRCLHCDATFEKKTYDEIIKSWNRRAENENI